ncbi:MAG: sugar ABC transporter ATP-binding protein [Bacillota bacterium]
MTTGLEQKTGVVLMKGEGLSKSFPGVRALHEFSIELRQGEVLALVGENGAGKSTLCNIVGGVFAPDSGTIAFAGNPVKIRSPQQAQEMGIAYVHQENSLLPHLTVAENIMLGHEPNRRGVLDQRGIVDAAARVLSGIYPSIDVQSMAFTLSPAETQMVEIAKALSRKPKVLILDEPTSSLSSIEVDHLMALLSTFTDEGIAVVFISHRLDEVFRAADRIMVMKDGELVGVKDVDDITRDQLITMMVGREMTHTFPPRLAEAPGEVALKLAGATVPGKVFGVDLQIRAKEIVGLGGLEGQGQRELVRALFGVERFTSGRMSVLGREGFPKSPSDAIKSRLAFISDDRKVDGLALPLSVSQNMILADLKRFTRFGLIDLGKERTEVGSFIVNLGIKTPTQSQKAKNLSGGNQQKVIFGKWLMTGPKVFVLHEPTRGIDVQTKMDIYRLLRDLANAGAAVLVLTSDMLELIGLSDRIYIMYEGKMVGSMPGAEASEEKLMLLSSGGGEVA